MQNTKTEDIVSMNGPSISAETAEHEFARLAGYYDLDPEDDPEGPLSEIWGTVKKKLLAAIRKGHLELEEDDRGRLFVIQHLRCKANGLPSSFRYKPLNVAAKMAMKDGSITSRRGERVEKGQYEKMYLLMGSLAGVEQSVIRKIEGPDVGLMEYLSTLFLAV